MDGIAHLIAATASFVGTHLVLSHPLRAPLVARIGERGFLGLYSLVAALTLGWMIVAAGQTPAQAPLWIAPVTLWHMASPVMLLASILLIGAYMGNPAIVDPTGKPNFPDAPRSVLAITRHPLMWAILLWALVHATLWGTATNLIITGGIGLLALLGMIGQDAKKARLIGQPWRDWQGKTGFIPFAAQVTHRLPWRAALPGPVALIGGTALWLGATYLHPLLGGPVAGLWMWLQ